MELQALIDSHFEARKKEEEELVALKERIVSAGSRGRARARGGQAAVTRPSSGCRRSAVRRELNSRGSGPRRRGSVRTGWR